MDMGLLPIRVLNPTQRQVLHIGFEGGMHSNGGGSMLQAFKLKRDYPKEFHGTEFVGDYIDPIRRNPAKKYGGWGHAADHKHCLQVLQG